MSGAPVEPVLLSLVRSPRGLTALYSRQNAAVHPRRGEPRVDPRTGFAAETGAPPRTERAVIAAWERLRSAPPVGPDVLADVLHVLLSTVPTAVREPVAAFRVEEPPRPARPTAAHPRAFRGTKRKPAKRSRPAERDLTPHLCSTASTHALLTALWPERGRARALLRPRGFEAEALERVTGTAVAHDPYLAYHHAGAPARTSLPPAFVERLLPALHSCAWPLVRRAAALHARLDLTGDVGLTALIARLMTVAGAEAGLAWVEAAEMLPAARRFAFIAFLLEAGAWRRDPSLLPPSVLLDLGVAPESAVEDWTWEALKAVAANRNGAYVAAGLRVALDYSPNSSFRVTHDAPDFSDRTAAALDRAVPPDWDGYERFGLWEACGSIPGAVTYLKGIDWARYSTPRRAALLRLLMGQRWRDEVPVSAQTWRSITTSLPAFERHLLEVPEAYASQYGNDTGEILYTLTTPAAIRERLPLALDLLARLNHPPFDKDGHLPDVLAHLLKLPAAQRRRVLDAPDAPYLRLDKACRRENDANLVAWGLSNLVDRVPDLVSDAFLAAPALLFRTARELGVLSWPARTALLGALRGTPLFDANLADRPLAALVATLDASGLPEGKAAVPRAVREHLAGRRALTGARIEQHRVDLTRALPTHRLAAIQAAVESRLAASIGAREATRDLLSALAVLQHADKNRRSLRRVLRAFAEGEADFLRHHPDTRAWERRHPRIDLDLWTRGVDADYAGDDGRRVSLRTEQNPVEVLKMGTYVGSCLGLGGRFTDSAAAVLLDVNKQVVYVRDDRGTVLARQLVALTKDDRLVPFAVYPRSTPRWIRHCVDEHDRRLAASLGVELARRGDPYLIEHVLSQEWWDDGLWEPADDDED
jgi:hypothetical protein